MNVNDLIERLRGVAELGQWQDIESALHQRMMRQAVKQTFFGGIRVDPRKLPITREQGERALKSLRK